MNIGNYAPYYRQNYYQSQPVQTAQGVQDNTAQYMPQYQPMQLPQMPQSPQISQIPPMPMQVQTVSDKIIVLNENEATSYFVAPNNSVTLWDKNMPTIYVKSADANGVPSMRILDYVERAPNTPKNAQEHVCQCSGKFVKIEDFQAMREEINALAAKIEEFKPKAKVKKVEVDENE